MMQGAITDDQARALCTFLALIRPDRKWDVPGIRAALHKARHKAPAHELAIAAIRCAMRDDIKTPALIAEDGAHWQGTKAAEDTRFARCPRDGHTSYPAHNCGACRSEDLGNERPANQPDPTAPTPEQIETYARGARLVRAALEDAANNRQEQDR